MSSHSIRCDECAAKKLFWSVPLYMNYTASHGTSPVCLATGYLGCYQDMGLLDRSAVYAPGVQTADHKFELDRSYQDCKHVKTEPTALFWLCLCCLQLTIVVHTACIGDCAFPC